LVLELGVGQDAVDHSGLHTTSVPNKNLEKWLREKGQIVQSQVITGTAEPC